MSESMHCRARLAALMQHNADARVIFEARRDLAAVMLRKRIDRDRAAAGLPPLSDEVTAALVALAFSGTPVQ